MLLNLLSQNGPLIGPAHSVYFHYIWVLPNWCYIIVVYFFIAVIKSQLFLREWVPSLEISGKQIVPWLQSIPSTVYLTVFINYYSNLEKKVDLDYLK